MCNPRTRPQNSNQTAQNPLGKNKNQGKTRAKFTETKMTQKNTMTKGKNQVKNIDLPKGKLDLS